LERSDRIKRDSDHASSVKSRVAVRHLKLPLFLPEIPQPHYPDPGEYCMAKIAKTADRKRMMDTTKSTDCPKCGKPTRIVKRVKDRERNVGGGVFISCSVCEFYERL